MSWRVTAWHPAGRGEPWRHGLQLGDMCWVKAPLTALPVVGEIVDLDVAWLAAGPRLLRVHVQLRGAPDRPPEVGPGSQPRTREIVVRRPEHIVLTRPSTTPALRVVGGRDVELICHA